ncbi:MAG: substrate-binding domain-containing protein [bacterium]
MIRACLSHPARRGRRYAMRARLCTLTERSTIVHQTVRWWIGVPDWRAIFALNDDMAPGALTVLRVRGFRVPEDVTLMGFDDAPGARFAGLSTVRIPMAELGRRAARAALQKVLGGPCVEVEPVRGELVARTSCGCR